MQRWFFLESSENEERRNAPPETSKDTVSVSAEEGPIPPRKWLFRVRAPDLQRDEVVCVVGSVATLGCWQPDRCVPLEREDLSEIWSKIVEVPDRENVDYRYCVCVLVDGGNYVIVRSWEGGIQPRVIHEEFKSPSRRDEPEMYGVIGGKMCKEKGWLNKETVIQLQLMKGALALWKEKYSRRSVFIKVTPVNIKRHGNNIPKTSAEALDESLSADTQDTMETPVHAYTEIGGILNDDNAFVPQSQFGKEFKEEDMLIFQSTVLFPANIAFLVDLFIYSKRACEGDPPYHAGFTYILPSALQGSTGELLLPVTSTKHRPLGQITLKYLVFRPLNSFRCDMKISYTRHWKKERGSLDVGHRGCGSSFKFDMKNCSEVRENTIASLKTACEHGADFVEFDVQLSKDLVPIIYHDYSVCICMKKKRNLEDTDMLELPLKDLTLDQLRLLQVYHLTEGKSKNPRFFDEDLEEHQPFPTLRQVLEELDPLVGFNIEVKWTMQYKDGTFELSSPFDPNVFLDIILECVLQYGGKRRIVFSCFNPDVCAMIRMKQCKYPVMFLTQGQTERYQHYNDPRCWSIEAATRYAMMIDILGIVVHTEDLLKDPSQIQLAKQSEMVAFCWGDDNTDPSTIRFLKDLGMHGVIFDKINQYSGKEVKESIFLVEARESQKELIRLAANKAEIEREKALSPPPPVQPRLTERPMDVEKVRMRMDADAVSTATLLSSLESREGLGGNPGGGDAVDEEVEEEEEKEREECVYDDCGDGLE